MQTDAYIRERSGQHRTATPTKNQPKGPKEFRTIHLTLSPIHPFYCPAYSSIMETQMFRNLLHRITITNISIINGSILSCSFFPLFYFEEFPQRGSCYISLDPRHLFY